MLRVAGQVGDQCERPASAVLFQICSTQLADRTATIVVGLFWQGTGGGTRTLTGLPPMDFESIASANSATPASSYLATTCIIMGRSPKAATRQAVQAPDARTAGTRSLSAAHPAAMYASRRARTDGDPRAASFEGDPAGRGQSRATRTPTRQTRRRTTITGCRPIWVSGRPWVLSAAWKAVWLSKSTPSRRSAGAAPIRQWAR